MALPICRRKRDLKSIAHTTFFLGMVANFFGHRDEALELVNESRVLNERTGRDDLVARCDELIAALVNATEAE